MDKHKKDRKDLASAEPARNEGNHRNAGSSRVVLLLNGLGCANCAALIEQAVSDMPGVSAVTVDFAAARMKLEISAGENMAEIVKKASRIAMDIESGLTVSLVDEIEKRQRTAAQGSFARLHYNPRYLPVIIGAAFYLTAFLLGRDEIPGMVLFIIAYLLTGGTVLLKAGRNILHGKVFDENFLMSIATIGAFAIGEFGEAVAVMLFYRAGEFMQEAAVAHSRRSIADLMNIRPDYANIVKDGETLKVSPETVNPGDIILVRPGERVPLDGTVTQGISALDTSALTGEALPREVAAGDKILSGSVNMSGLLHLEVSRSYGESTVNRILELVQNASSKKSATENFITKFAKRYTPAVVFIAAALAVLPPLLIPAATFDTWIHRALVFLVVSCPCALIISIPMGFFAGIGKAASKGILFKGGNYLEALNNVHTVAFDKTGTLTEGTFKVTGIFPEERLSSEALLELAAYAELHSSHPAARSILGAYGSEPDSGRIISYEELPGFGTRTEMQGMTILAGNAGLMRMEHIPFEEHQADGTVVYIASDGRYEGRIVISDEIKPDSYQAVRELRAAGVSRIVMLTGDRKISAGRVSAELNLDGYFAELLPADKLEKLEELESQLPAGSKLVYAGDGINDAPILARADIGIAMGGIGSDAAIEAADIVLMTDEPSSLVRAITIAATTRKVVWQNIIFALAVKSIVLVLGAAGIASMWAAVFADVGVTILAVFNSLRIISRTNGDGSFLS
ncbi:MAG: heavy metal translocating P-type ATPase [Saccharofermentanales bacterium]